MNKFDHSKALALGSKLIWTAGLSFISFILSIPIGIYLVSLIFFISLILSLFLLGFIGLVGLIFSIQSLIEVIKQEIKNENKNS